MDTFTVHSSPRTTYTSLIPSSDPRVQVSYPPVVCMNEWLREMDTGALSSTRIMRKC